MTLNCVQLKSMPALDLNLLVRKVHKVHIFQQTIYIYKIIYSKNVKKHINNVKK